MRINTKTDTLELTKPEEVILGKAADLITKIAKHASGKVQTAGEQAKEAVNELISELGRTEVTNAAN
jgi:hypothetical protein